MKQIAFGRIWPWGLAALFVGALAVLAWGRWSASDEPMTAEPVGSMAADPVVAIPPLDQQAPENLETATFSLG